MTDQTKTTTDEIADAMCCTTGHFGDVLDAVMAIVDPIVAERDAERESRIAWAEEAAEMTEQRNEARRDLAFSERSYRRAHTAWLAADKRCKEREQLLRWLLAEAEWKLGQRGVAIAALSTRIEGLLNLGDVNKFSLERLYTIANGAIDERDDLRARAVLPPENWRECLTKDTEEFGARGAVALVESWISSTAKAPPLGPEPWPQPLVATVPVEAITPDHPDHADWVTDTGACMASQCAAHGKPPTLAETRTGADWCPNCREEAGTNRDRDDADTERCGTCGTELEAAP